MEKKFSGFVSYVLELFCIKSLLNLWISLKLPATVAKYLLVSSVSHAASCSRETVAS